MIEYLKRALEAEITVESLAKALAELDGNVSSDELDRLADALAGVVHSVPDALAHALAMSKDERCGRAIAFATGSILTYLLDPDDLIAESNQGQVGLLDDSYLVHTFATQLRTTYPIAESPVPYSPPSARSLEIVAALLPDGVAQSLARTSERIIAVAQALFISGPQGRALEPDHELDIRVAGAVQALAGLGEESAHRG
jgi:hypothetical protein